MIREVSHVCCLNQILKCFLLFWTHEIASTTRVPQMVDKINIRFAEDIGKPNRISSIRQRSE